MQLVRNKSNDYKLNMRRNEEAKIVRNPKKPFCFLRKYFLSLLFPSEVQQKAIQNLTQADFVRNPFRMELPTVRV